MGNLNPLAKVTATVSDQTHKLSGFSLKISGKDQQLVKLLCAMDEEIGYQYELIDEAVEWAYGRRNELVPIATLRNGERKTFYVGRSIEKLKALQKDWDCPGSRALHTALYHYLRKQSEQLGPLSESGSF